MLIGGNYYKRYYYKGAKLATINYIPNSEGNLTELSVSDGD